MPNRPLLLLVALVLGASSAWAGPRLLTADDVQLYLRVVEGATARDASFTATASAALEQADAGVAASDVTAPGISEGQAALDSSLAAAGLTPDEFGEIAMAIMGALTGGIVDPGMVSNNPLRAVPAGTSVHRQNAEVVGPYLEKIMAASAASLLSGSSGGTDSATPPQVGAAGASGDPFSWLGAGGGAAPDLSEALGSLQQLFDQ